MGWGRGSRWVRGPGGRGYLHTRSRPTSLHSRNRHTIINQLLSHAVVSKLFHKPMHCGPPGSSVHGMFQARTLEWVAISLARDLPDPGIEPESPALADRFFTTEPAGNYTPTKKGSQGSFRVWNFPKGSFLWVGRLHPHPERWQYNSSFAKSVHFTQGLANTSWEGPEGVHCRFCGTECPIATAQLLCGMWRAL